MNKSISRTLGQGFTAVEITIVVVAIGILASITLVSYAGLKLRAQAVAASSGLVLAANNIAVWQFERKNFSIVPSTLAEANVQNTTGEAGVTYQYSPGTNGKYCITATVGSVAYKMTDKTVPTIGKCPGHS